MTWCAKASRLLNGTLIENVTFGHAYHEQRIQETLESCALLQVHDSGRGGRLSVGCHQRAVQEYRQKTHQVLSRSSAYEAQVEDSKKVADRAPTEGDTYQKEN